MLSNWIHRYEHCYKFVIEHQVNIILDEKKKEGCEEKNGSESSAPEVNLRSLITLQKTDPEQTGSKQENTIRESEETLLCGLSGRCTQ